MRWLRTSKDEQVATSGGNAESEPEDSEHSRFARFAKKLVQVPKNEIDEKAEEWKRDRDRER